MTTPTPRALFATLLLALAACSSPPSHLTRLWPAGVRGEPVLGLSTEEGVLVLADRSYRLGDLFDVQFPIGNSRVDETGELIRVNDNLGVVRPLTARLLEGRLATARPGSHEQLYLALRDADDAPVMEPVVRWRGGERGDLIVPPEERLADIDAFARDTAGAGVYVYRDDHWQIVGMMSGLVVASADPGTPDTQATSVGYVGLDELRRAVSDGVDYVNPEFLPRRTDFEFGVERQPDDIAIDDWRTMNPEAPPKAPVKPGPGGPAGGAAIDALGAGGTPRDETAPTDAPAGDGDTIDFLELLQREAERAAGGTDEPPAGDDAGSDAPASDEPTGDDGPDTAGDSDGEATGADTDGATTDDPAPTDDPAAPDAGDGGP